MKRIHGFPFPSIIFHIQVLSLIRGVFRCLNFHVVIQRVTIIWLIFSNCSFKFYRAYTHYTRFISIIDLGKELIHTCYINLLSIKHCANTVSYFCICMKYRISRLIDEVAIEFSEWKIHWKIKRDDKFRR